MSEDEKLAYERTIEELNLQCLDYKRTAADARIRLMDASQKMNELDEEISRLRKKLDAEKADTLTNSEFREFIQRYGHAIRGLHHGWWESYANSFEVQIAKWPIQFDKEDEDWEYCDDRYP